MMIRPLALQQREIEVIRERDEPNLIHERNGKKRKNRMEKENYTMVEVSANFSFPYCESFFPRSLFLYDFSPSHFVPLCVR